MDGISMMLFINEFFVNLFEKIKNLLCWKNPKATKTMFLFLIFLLVAVTFLPIRYIIIIFIFKKFSKGKRYWDRVRKNNREVAIIELTNFFRSKGIKNFSFDQWPKLNGM